MLLKNQKPKNIKKLKNIKRNTIAFKCNDTILEMIEHLAKTKGITKSKAVNLLLDNTEIIINSIDNYSREDKQILIRDLARVGNLYLKINSIYTKIVTNVKRDNLGEIEYQIFNELKSITKELSLITKDINEMKYILNKIDKEMVTYGNSKNKS